MLKKTGSVVIIMCMMLHCASRLGFLSYLYENRNNLAYQAGLIAEIPIAICSSDYDFNKGLSIQQDESRQSIPGGIPDAIEIILFVPPASFDLTSPLPFVKSEINNRVQMIGYASPQFEIFHPPLG